MELIVMAVLPFPIGYLVRNRLAAFVAYVAVHGFVFTYQTLELVREWVAGSDRAFDRDGNVSAWQYALVNALIFAAGLGLVWLGHRLASRRQRRPLWTVGRR